MLTDLGDGGRTAGVRTNFATNLTPSREQRDHHFSGEKIVTNYNCSSRKLHYLTSLSMNLKRLHRWEKIVYYGFLKVTAIGSNSLPLIENSLQFINSLPLRQLWPAFRFEYWRFLMLMMNIFHSHHDLERMHIEFWHLKLMLFDVRSDEIQVFQNFYEGFFHW